MAEKKGVNGKHIAFGLLIGALCGAAGAIIPLAAYVAPAFLAFTYAAWGAAGLVPALAGAAAAAFLLLDAQSAAYSLALFVPPALLIGFLVRAQKPWRAAVTAASFAMGVALYLNLSLPAILAGGNAFAPIKEFVSQYSAQMLALLSAAQAADAQALALMNEFFINLREMVPQIVIYTFCAMAMFFSLVDVLIARALTKKSGVALRPMEKFMLWQLSPQYTYATFAAVAGVLVVLLARLSNADAVFAVGVSVVVMPLMLTGVCYMEFILKTGEQKGVGRRIAFYALSLVLFPYSLIFLGLMDRVTRIRTRYTAGKNTGES